jgi:hypothetical protein
MQAVIGWTCVLVLISGICIGFWWTVRALIPGTTTITGPDPTPPHLPNLKGAIHLSGKGVEGALVKSADGICRNPVSVRTAAGGSFSADCDQVHPNDVILLSADYDQDGKHCHAQTDSSVAYKLTDEQVLELTCEH